MLAIKMRELIDRFNTEHPDVKVTAVYTGSYDDTNLKTRAAIKAGRSLGAVIMSANFVREYVINDDADAFDPLIEKDGKSPEAFMDQFWPALKPNAVIAGRVYGIPFQNSTPRAMCATPRRLAGPRRSCPRAILRSAKRPPGR
jgi:sn-glycerol 3-phosphate transport system substrate-binding protein